jgi:predicted dehydrogenase
MSSNRLPNERCLYMLGPVPFTLTKGEVVTRRLRLGVIGAGSWALAAHLPNFAMRGEEVEFVGVVRRDPVLREKIKTDWGFSFATDDYLELLEQELDICLVSSPTALHYEQAKAAIESGAHVLLEKPITIDPAEAWDIVRTAERFDRHVVCAFGWNFKPMVRGAKKLMEERGIGEVEQIVIHMSSATRELLSNTGAYPAAAPESVPAAETWTDPALSGGGYAQAQLSHALGLGLWLTGLRGREVFAFMSTILNSPVEHYDACSLRFTNDAIGTLAGGSAHLGFDDNKHELVVRAIGSEGHFTCDLQRELIWLYRAGGEDIRPEVQPGDGLYDCDGPAQTIVDLALDRPVTNWAPGELGARTVEILEAAYRSSRSGRCEEVQLDTVVYT